MKQQADAQKFQAQTELRIKEIQMQADAKIREQQASLTLQATNDERDAQRESVQKQMEAQLAAVAQENQRVMAEMKLQMDKYTADLDAQTRLQIEMMRHESSDSTETDMSPMQEKIDALEAMLMAPTEIIRDETGRVAGVKRGNIVRRVTRGPDGKVMGVQ